MSSTGYPDFQRITQWVGTPLAQGTGVVVGAGTVDVGPLSVYNFASIVVCVKPTGGAVGVTVTQEVPGGPTSLVTSSAFTVTDGDVLFEAFVLLGGAVSIEFQGENVGETIDYAIVPTNTNTNAEVAALTQLGFQHNNALIATETAIDLIDAAGFAWTFVDDPANLRMKITPPSKDITQIFDTTLAVATATVTISAIPATFAHLLLVIGDAANNFAAATRNVNIRMNGDTGAHYQCQTIVANGATLTAAEVLATTGVQLSRLPGTTATLQAQALTCLIPDYASAQTARAIRASGAYVTASGTLGVTLDECAGLWTPATPVTSLSLFVPSTTLTIGTRISLYGLR